MNITEHMWDALQNVVQRRYPSHTPMDMWTALQDTLHVIPGYLKTLVESMPYHSAELLQAHGSPTLYYAGVPLFLALQYIKKNTYSTYADMKRSI